MINLLFRRLKLWKKPVVLAEVIHTGVTVTGGTSVSTITTYTVPLEPVPTDRDPDVTTR